MKICFGPVTALKFYFLHIIFNLHEKLIWQVLLPPFGDTGYRVNVIFF